MGGHVLARRRARVVDDDSLDGEGGDSGATVEETHSYRNLYYDNAWGGEDAGDGYGTIEGLPALEQMYEEAQE